jgi:hypothetical protein
MEQLHKGCGMRSLLRTMFYIPLVGLPRFIRYPPFRIRMYCHLLCLITSGVTLNQQRHQAKYIYSANCLLCDCSQVPLLLRTSSQTVPLCAPAVRYVPRLLNHASTTPQFANINYSHAAMSLYRLLWKIFTSTSNSPMKPLPPTCIIHR